MVFKNMTRRFRAAHPVREEIRRQCRRLKENDDTLRYLNLNSNEVTVEEAILVLRAISNNTILISLKMNNNSLGDSPALSSAIAACMASNVTMEELWLVGNDFGPTVSTGLGQGLAINKSIKKLALTRNNLGVKGIKKIAEGLADNRVLETLFLSQTMLGNKGVEVLAQTGLRHNAHLHSLTLAQNKISNKGLLALLEAIQQHRVVRELRLDQNRLSDEMIEDVLTGLGKSPTQKILDFGEEPPQTTVPPEEEIPQPTHVVDDPDQPARPPPQEAAVAAAAAAAAQNPVSLTPYEETLFNYEHCLAKEKDLIRFVTEWDEVTVHKSNKFFDGKKLGEALEAELDNMVWGEFMDEVSQHEHKAMMGSEKDSAFYISLLLRLRSLVFLCQALVYGMVDVEAEGSHSQAKKLLGMGLDTILAQADANGDLLVTIDSHTQFGSSAVNAFCTLQIEQSRQECRAGIVFVVLFAALTELGLGNSHGLHDTIGEVAQCLVKSRGSILAPGRTGQEMAITVFRQIMFPKPGSRLSEVLIHTDRGSPKEEEPLELFAVLTAEALEMNTDDVWDVLMHPYRDGTEADDDVDNSDNCKEEGVYEETKEEEKNEEEMEDYGDEIASNAKPVSKYAQVDNDSDDDDDEQVVGTENDTEKEVAVAEVAVQD